MNLHEYQGKEILQNNDVPIQRGKVASSVNEAISVANELKKFNKGVFVIKAQVHAGGRGKGGGIKLAKNISEVEEVSDKILGMKLVTPQTTSKGKLVSKVLIAEDVYYPGESETKEFYVSILLDRGKARNIIVYSKEGGMDIEQVSEESPHLIFKEFIDPRLGIQSFQLRNIAFNLGLSGEAFKEMTLFIKNLYKAYINSDASLFEINPVLKTSDNKIIAVDCKVSIDDNSIFRQKELSEKRDLDEENPVEVEAKSFGLSYVDLDGNVGCMVNGAGLAMATMDLIKHAGGEPANFLDVGGTADPKRVEAGFRIILKDPNVKAILVNIFGGIVRCDRVAEGIVSVFKKMGDEINVPIIVRLEGTNSKIAKEIIDSSGFNVISAKGFQEAAIKVQQNI